MVLLGVSSEFNFTIFSHHRKRSEGERRRLTISGIDPLDMFDGISGGAFHMFMGQIISFSFVFLLLWFGGKLVCFTLVFIKFVYYKMFGFNFLFFRKEQGYLEDAQFKHVSCDVSLIFLHRAVWFCFPLFMVYMSSQTLERKTMRGSLE